MKYYQSAMATSVESLKMNDFTKDELQKLYALALIHDNETVSDLRKKLLSMIDNYCEHESEIDIGECPMICKKCGKVTG